MDQIGLAQNAISKIEFLNLNVLKRQRKVFNGVIVPACLTYCLSNIIDDNRHHAKVPLD